MTVTTDGRVSMEPQCFCSLPWCGKAFGGPMKRFKADDGSMVEYPEGIDFHHVDGHHKGVGIYICHDCHMANHFKNALEIRWKDGAWLARRPWTDEPFRRLVTWSEP